ncbi:flagellar protein FlgN [Anaerosporobacter sp.]|uniref:flagellar protein FlgN n=1 Tax=Anaerosporobacter sp. TaxID=1872529 RepID=UPI00286EF9E0|nr:flagellar protein FlgN [Anaerosporobacter sp.]
MASLIEELITTLQQENEIYSEMVPIAKEKSSIIANNDLLALQEITDKEQVFVEQVMVLDKKREEIIANIGVVLCKDARTLKIQDVIKLLEAQPEEQERLASVHANLKNTISLLMEFNNHNKSLIEQSLEIIEFNMNFVQSTRMSPGNNYTKTAGQVNSALPETGMFDAKQ